MARDSMLKEKLLSNKFYMHELKLYLDTHPTDKVALAEFRKYRDEFMRLKDEYVSCGEIWTAADAGEKSAWDWIESPWPWEYQEGN